MFWYVGGELGVGWLGGDFENGCHGFVLCPGWFLCQHFHNSTPEAPGKGDRKKKVRIDSHNNAQCSERTSKQPTSRYSSALKTAIKWLCAQQTPCVHRFWARPANVAAFTTVRLAVKCWDREAGFHCGSHCTKNCEVSSVWLSLAQILLSKHLH